MFSFGQVTPTKETGSWLKATWSSFCVMAATAFASESSFFGNTRGAPCNSRWWWLLQPPISHAVPFLQFLLTCPVFKQRKQQRLSFTISALFSIGSPWNRGQDERLWCPWQYKHDVAAVSTVKAELDVEKTLGFFGWNVAVGFSCLKLLTFSITYREAYFSSNQSARVVSVAFCGSILNKWSPHSSASLGDIFTTSLRNF